MAEMGIEEPKEEDKASNNEEDQVGQQTKGIDDDADYAFTKE